MKKLLNISGVVLSFIALSMVFSCDEGIDPISQVEPGPDTSPPVVAINYPTEGTKIRVVEDVTSIEIDFEVEDDIEIASVKLLLNGNQIAVFESFLDYRRLLETFNYDNVTNGQHVLTVEAVDLSGKSSSQSVNFEKIAPYEPLFSNEVFYMPFDGDYLDLISLTNATVVGNPGFAGESITNDSGTNAYQGEDASYLTIPTEAFFDEVNNELSATFWYKLDANPNRAGVLVVGPPDDTNPDNANNRRAGFRFFREAAGGMQRFKLNVGNGDGENWFDGGANADVDPSVDKWVHFAFTISDSYVTVYIDGNIVREGDFPGISWNNCDVLSIMSGAPRFVGWNHRSDQSIMDELRIFNKALTQQEIDDIIAATS